MFDFIYKMKDSIETEFGGELELERMDEKVSCRIKSELTGVSYFEQSDWNKMIGFLINTTVKMEKHLRTLLGKLILM